MSDMRQVTYRRFSPNDFDIIAQLLGDLWYGHLCETSRYLCGEAELALHLSAHTFPWVVEVDNAVMGIALARFGAPSTEASQWASLHKALFAQALRNTRLDIDFELAACAEEKNLSEYRARMNCGFLELLAVNPKAQGLGIGGKLFRLVEDYLRAEGAEILCLVTDDDCDWNFYEYKGLRRVAEGKAQTPRGELSCYAYEGTL